MAKTSGKEIDIQVVPFNRSIRDVIEGKADFHMPLIKNDIVDLNKLEYTYAKPVLWHVNFVLYTNKDKPIDKSKLKDYKIETDLAHVSYFDFPVKGSTRIDSSLKKVNAGRIDGFIFADFAADPIIKKEGLKNVHRELYKVFDSCMVLPKGEKGKATDVFLTETIEKMRAATEVSTKSCRPLINLITIGNPSRSVNRGRPPSGGRPRLSISPPPGPATWSAGDRR